MLKHHKFFVKKPLADSLIRVEKFGNHDILKIKWSYLEQFEEMAPNYLAESFEAEIDEGGTRRSVTIQVNIFNKEFPGILYIYKGKKQVREKVKSLAKRSVNSLSFLRYRQCVMGSKESTLQTTHGFFGG